MVRVHSCTTAFEAHLVRTALAQAGIDARIRNEDLASLAGAIPLVDCMPEVWVEAEDRALAQEVLDQALDDIEQGRLSVVSGEDGEGWLSPEHADPKSKDATAPSPPFADARELDEPDPQEDVDPGAGARRSLVFPFVLALFFSFGTGHMYARAWKRGFAVAALEVALIVSLFGGLAVPRGLFLALVAFDALGGAIAVRQWNRRLASMNG